MTGRRVLLVVPTTAGPLIVRSLRPREGLPSAAAFATGDYRPLPWSGDFARLSTPGGPLARLAGLGTTPFELRLSGSFDAGRSWEVPVSIALGLAAAGETLVDEPEHADLVVWATGVVDLDLGIVPGSYALRDKIERSRALLDRAAGAELAIVLPDGDERLDAERDFAALGRTPPARRLPNGSVGAALGALLQPVRPVKPSRPPVSRTVKVLGVAASAAIIVGIVSLVAIGAFHGEAVPEGPAGAQRAPEPALAAVEPKPPIPVVDRPERPPPDGADGRR